MFEQDDKRKDLDYMEDKLNGVNGSRETLMSDNYFNSDYDNMSAGERLIKAKQDLDDFVNNANFELTMDIFSSTTDMPVQNDVSDSRKRLLDAVNALYCDDFDTSEVLGEETSTKRSK